MRIRFEGMAWRADPVAPTAHSGEPQVMLPRHTPLSRSNQMSNRRRSRPSRFSAVDVPALKSVSEQSDEEIKRAAAQFWLNITPTVSWNAMLISPRFARECMVCAETIVDMTDGTSEEEKRWSERIARDGEFWQTAVRTFPASSWIPECAGRHKLDICLGCIAICIKTQLETMGRAGCDKLACAVPDCSHIYTHRQVQRLTSKEIFAKYDEFLLLNHLETLPNFRRCLRPGCEAGQIHDLSDVPSRYQDSFYHIVCRTCHFEMCFKHQTPWHTGLSCSKYDAWKAYGDPDVAATRKWIHENTKRCPGLGCGLPIHKGEGCFHMKCSSCSSEFCWECLVDWKKITRGGSGWSGQDRNGHAEGCYFRRSEDLPTMLRGKNLEAALQRRGEV